MRKAAFLAAAALAAVLSSQPNVAVAAGDKAQAEAVFKSSVSTIDSIADKNIIHKNKAARHKSRLSAAIKAIGSKGQAAAQA